MIDLLKYLLLESSVKMKARNGRTSRRRIAKKKKLEKFKEKITHLSVGHAMIYYLEDDLYHFGLQHIKYGEEIQIDMEYRLPWTIKEINTLIVLWILLGRP